jgi:hypothetical protein
MNTTLENPLPAMELVGGSPALDGVEPRDTCMRENCCRPAVGYIPMPKGELHYGGSQGMVGTGRYLDNIHVCELHYRKAVKLLFWVVRYGENDKSASFRHDKLITEKHREVVKRRLLLGIPAPAPLSAA